jgi:rubrerythrin
MMDKYSRREFLYLSASLPLLFPLRVYANNEGNNYRKIVYTHTILILKYAFTTEMMAHEHYLGYVEKAMAEKYPNIAYMFKAFSISEKVHADNYARIVDGIGGNINKVKLLIDIRDTRSNLIQAAENEMEKIETIYPGFLKELETEGYEEAIINCMYSWKSHQQHEKKIKEIQKYSGMFFGAVAKKIEGMDLDFHVCEICGSTIDIEPNLPCDICYRSMSHYKKVNRPV